MNIEELAEVYSSNLITTLGTLEVGEFFIYKDDTNDRRDLDDVVCKVISLPYLWMDNKLVRDISSPKGKQPLYIHRKVIKL